jgi:beta-glucosidase
MSIYDKPSPQYVYWQGQIVPADTVAGLQPEQPTQQPVQQQPMPEQAPVQPQVPQIPSYKNEAGQTVYDYAALQNYYAQMQMQQQAQEQQAMVMERERTRPWFDTVTNTVKSWVTTNPLKGITSMNLPHDITKGFIDSSKNLARGIQSLSELGINDALGFNMGALPSLDWLEKQSDKYRKGTIEHDADRGETGFIPKIIEGALEGLLPSMSIPYAGGALVGAGAGLLTGGATGPAAPVTAPVAAVTAGNMARTSLFYLMSVGELYYDAVEAGVDPEVARGIAAAVGLPYAAVENMQFKHLFGGAGTKSVVDQIKEYVKNADASKKEIFAKAAKVWMTNTLKETAEEGVQKAMSHAQTGHGLRKSDSPKAEDWQTILSGAAQAGIQEAVDVFPGMVATAGLTAGGTAGRHMQFTKSEDVQKRAKEIKESGVIEALEELESLEKVPFEETRNIHDGDPDWANRFRAAGATVTPVHLEHQPDGTTREQAQQSPVEFLVSAIEDLSSDGSWSKRTGLDKNSFLAEDLTKLAQDALASGNAEDVTAAVDTLMNNGFEPVSNVERAFQITLPKTGKSIIVTGINKSEVHKDPVSFLKSTRAYIDETKQESLQPLARTIDEALNSGDKSMIYIAVEGALDAGIKPSGQLIKFGDHGEMGVVALMRLMAPSRFALGNENIHEESHLARLLFMTKKENERIEQAPEFQRNGKFDEEIWARHVQSRAESLYDYNQRLKSGDVGLIEKIVHNFQTRVMDFLRNLFGYKSVDQISREIIDGTLIKRGVVSDASFQESLNLRKEGHGLNILEKEEGDAIKEKHESQIKEGRERAEGYQRAAEITVGQQIAEGREEAAEAREKETAEQLIKESDKRQDAEDLEEMAIEIEAEEALKREELEKIREEIEFLEEYEALEKEEEIEKLKEKERKFQEEIEFAQLLREEEAAKEKAREDARIKEYAEKHGLKGRKRHIIENHMRRTEREAEQKELEEIQRGIDAIEQRERGEEESRKKIEHEKAAEEWLKKQKAENPNMAISEDLIRDPLERAKVLRRNDEEAPIPEKYRKKVKTEEESIAAAEEAAKEASADAKYVEERIAKNESRAKDAVKVTSQEVRDEIAETTAAANRAIANIFKNVKIDDLGTSLKVDTVVPDANVKEVSENIVSKKVVEVPAPTEVVDNAIDEGKPTEEEKSITESVDEVMDTEEEWISARETASMLGPLKRNLASYKLTGQIVQRKDGKFKKQDVLNIIEKEKEIGDSPETKMLEGIQKVIESVKNRGSEAKVAETPAILAEKEGSRPLTQDMVDKTIEMEGDSGEAKTEEQISENTKKYVDAYKKGVLGFTTILEGPDVVSVPLSDITLSKDVPQFKQGANARGLTNPLAGQYQDVPARPIMLWRRNTGALEVITGRHRFALAQDTPGVSTIKAQILNESDGFTADMAAMMDITSNIQDEKGEVRDYAQFFREGTITEAEATAKGFLQTAKGKQGFAIGRYSSNELYSLYRSKHGNVSDKHRSAVDVEGWTESRFEVIATTGRTEDGDTDADLQNAAIKYIEKNPRVTNDHLLQWMNTMRHFKRQVSYDVDLFGNMIDNGYDAEAEAMASAAVSIQREEMLRRNIIENAKKQGRMQAISKQFGITVSVKFDDEADADRQLKASILKIEKLKEWYLHADITQEIRKRAGYVVDADAVLEAEQKDDDNKFNEPYQDGLFSVRISQPISSKDTSLNQIPATFKRVDWKPGTRHFDLGAGRSTKFQDALKERGVEMLRYDPFWGTMEENYKAVNDALDNPVDTVSVNNVLNVIEPLEAKIQTVRQAATVLKDDGEAYFLIHEGNKTGIGAPTPRGWQSNMKTAEYIPIVQRYFREVERKGNMIIARKPMHASGKWSPTENGVQFSVQVLSEEEYHAVSKSLIDMIEARIKAGVGAEVVLDALHKQLSESNPTVADYLINRIAEERYPHYLKKLVVTDSNMGIRAYEIKDRIIIENTKATGLTADALSAIQGIAGAVVEENSVDGKNKTIKISIPRRQEDALLTAISEYNYNQLARQAESISLLEHETLVRNRAWREQVGENDGYGRRISDEEAMALVSEKTKALIREGKKIKMSDKTLNDQIADIGFIVNAYEQGLPTALLASKAGAGKSFVIAGAIRELKARGVKSFGWITTGQQLIEQIKEDIKAYDIDDVVKYMGYNSFSQAVIGNRVETDSLKICGRVLFFDEAHSVKSLANRGVAARAVIEQSPFTVFSSATLSEDPSQLDYISKTGLFDNVTYTHPYGNNSLELEGFNAFLAAHGGIVGKGGTVHWRIGNRVGASLIYNWLYDRGVISRRSPDIQEGLVEGFGVTADGTTADEHQMAVLYNRAEDTLNLAVGLGANPMQIAMYTANMLNRIVERSKVQAAINIAKEEIASGQRVVIFTEGRSESRLDMWEVDKKEYTSEQIVEMYESYGKNSGVSKTLYCLAQAFKRNNLNDVLPSIIAQMQTALSKHGVSIYTGEINHREATANKNKFMRGETKVLLATMAKGGTGLSLHDKTGKFPTTQISMHVPWTGAMLDQVLGRTVRQGLSSKVRHIIIFNPALLKEYEKVGRVISRYRSMQNLVSGEESVITAGMERALTGSVGEWVPLNLMQFRSVLDEINGVQEDSTSSSFSVAADNYQKTLNDRGVNPVTNAIATDGSYWDLLNNVSDAVSSVRKDIHVLNGQGALQPIHALSRLLADRDSIEGSKWGEVTEYGKRFADAHKDIPASNEIQHELTRMAMAIGNMKFDAAQTHLNRIMYHINNGTYKDIASKRDDGSLYSVIQTHDVNDRDALLRVPLPGLYDIVNDMLGVNPKIVPVLFNRGESKGAFRRKADGSDPRIDLSSEIFAGKPVYEAEYSARPSKIAINALMNSVAEENGIPLEELTHVIAKRGKRHYLTIAHRDIDWAARTLAHEIGHADNYLTETMIPEDSPLYDIMAIGRQFKDLLAAAVKDPDMRGDMFMKVAHKLAEQHEITGEEAVNRMIDVASQFMEATVRQELRIVSEEMRGGWTGGWYSRKYQKYRESAEELYADFISGIFNAPRMVAEKAPHAYSLFKEFLDLHNLSESYKKVQKTLWAKTGPEEWLQRSLDMMSRDSIVRDEAIEKANSDRLPRNRHEVAREILYKFVDKTAYLPRSARQSVKDISYMSAPLTQFQRDIDVRVKNPLENAGIAWEEVGAYMMLRRAGTSGDRQDMANPGMLSGKYADQTLKELEKKIGADKYKILENAVAEYHKIRQETVFPRLKESKIFSEELMKQIEDNDTYASFDVQKHFKAYLSGTEYNAVVVKQFGTIESIMNPLFATIHKDASLMLAAQVNKAKLDSIEALNEFDSENIMEADSKFDPKKGVIDILDHPNKERWGTMLYNENGVTKGVYVRPQVADLFKRDPYQASVVFEAANFVTGIFKRMFTSNNPFFSIWNVQKDARKTLNAIPTDGKLMSEIMLAPDLARSYIRTIKDAWYHAVKKESTPLVRELLTQGLLIPDRQWKARETTGVDEYERLQAEYGVGEKKAEGMWRRVARFVFEDFNQMVETWGKVAGYEYMKRKGLTSQYDMRDIMRGVISSADFLAGGEYTKWTNMIFLYSNAGVQGLEAAYRDIRRSPMTYFARRMVYTILPTMAMLWLQYGEPDDPEEKEYQKAFRAIPDWEKKRMHVLPISFDGTNVTWVPLPQDHFGELLHGIIWSMIGSKEQNKGIAQALSVVGGSMPFEPGSLNPALQVGRAAFDLMTGSNPWDHFRERTVIDQQIYRAGGFRTYQEFAKWAWNQTGGSVVGRFDSPFDVREKPTAEKIPFVKAALQRFYRTAAAEEEFDPTEDKANARRTVSAKDFVVKTLSKMDNPKEITVGKAFSQWKKENPDIAKGYKLSSFRTIWKNASARRWPETAKKNK